MQLQQLDIDRLVERFRLHAVQRGDVAIKQHLPIADREHAGLRIMLKRKAPLAVLVALGGVGDADARGGGELDPRAVIPLSPLPHAPPQTCSRRIHRHSSTHPRP